MNDPQSADPQISEPPTSDARLIGRFGPVLAAALPPRDGSPHQEQVPVHAEALHQLCLADGLLELLDWSRQGVGADPLACMWLASLRWHRLVTGGFPEGAPEPPSRDLDAALLDALRGHGLSIRRGTGAVSLAGLASGEMAYPSAPAQPEADDAAALLRAVPVGMVPYIEEEMRRSWVRQAVSLTQGHPELIAAAERLALLVRCAASGAADADPLQELEEILQHAGADEEIAGTLRRQLRACSPGSPDEASAPHQAVEALTREWEQVTRPA